MTTLKTPCFLLFHFACTKTVGGILGALLPQLSLPASYQEAAKEHRVKAEEEEDDEAERVCIMKQTGGALYLAVELSPSVLLSWIIRVWHKVSYGAEVAGIHLLVFTSSISEGKLPKYCNNCWQPSHIIWGAKADCFGLSGGTICVTKSFNCLKYEVKQPKEFKLSTIHI